MHTILNQVTSFLKSEDGPTATEYAAMLALITLTAMGSIALLGNKMNTIFSYVGGNLPTTL